MPCSVLCCFYPHGRVLLFLRGEMYRVAIMQAAFTESVQVKIGKVMADGFFTALAAPLFGVCLAGNIKHVDGFPLDGTVFWAALPILGMF